MNNNINRTPYTYLIGWSSYDRWYYGCRYGRNCHPSDLWTTYFTSSKPVLEFRKKYGEPNIIQIRKTFTDIDKCRLIEHITLRRLKVVDKIRWLNKTDNKSIAIEEAMIGQKNRPSRVGVPNPKNSVALKGRIPWNKGLCGDYRCISGAIKAANTRKINDNYHPYNKGVPMTEQQKQKLREHKRTPEHCNNISLSKRGKPAHNKGIPMSKEQKEKISLANSGKNHPFYGKKLSEEHKRKIGEANKGKKFENISCPYCEKIGAGPNMMRYHFDNCSKRLT